MVVLGISCCYHDSAACIIKNGVILAAVQEERFTRKRHDASVPINSIEYCLHVAGITLSEVDSVVYYEDPSLKIDRTLGMVKLSKNAPNYIEKHLEKTFKDKYNTPQILRKKFGSIGKLDYLETSLHHLSHAASAFYPSPFESSAILVLDAVGEWDTNSIGYGNGKNINILRSLQFPDSLGLLYSAVTAFCGFKVNSGEYKLMGLAPYGEPKFKEIITNELIDIRQDGSYKLNIEAFSYYERDELFNEKFWVNLFKVQPRFKESNIDKVYMDIAASIQSVLEDVVLKQAVYAREITGSPNLVMAGGVALNCTANGKIIKNKIFENVWIQPASGDAGSSLGAALLKYYSMSESLRVLTDCDSQFGSLLGPSYENVEIEDFLSSENIIYKKLENNELFDYIATALTEKKVIGLFNNRMEFGPRSLGARSIIGDPRTVDMQERINLKIKFRESFRPFAPAVLAEKCSEYFELGNTSSPYMLVISELNIDKRMKTDVNSVESCDGNLISFLKSPRSSVAAITHVDYSARIQTVDSANNPFFYNVISKFYEKTGCPMVVNTSFNVRGEPIVCDPYDAFKCFMRTDMDLLVLENFIIEKSEQKINHYQNDNWKDVYELD